jgi:hypothetical protein
LSGEDIPFPWKPKVTQLLKKLPQIKQTNKQINEVEKGKNPSNKSLLLTNFYVVAKLM